MDAAVERKTLTPEQAAALRDIDEALREFSQLGVFIETHSREFREWRKDGEQRLEWSTLHAEYCRLVEGKVEMRLKLIGATGDDLYRLLADVQGNDKRADSFLKKLLAMSDYLDFCEMMMAWAHRDRWAGGRVISRPCRILKNHHVGGARLPPRQAPQEQQQAAPANRSRNKHCSKFCLPAKRQRSSLSSSSISELARARVAVALSASRRGARGP